MVFDYSVKKGKYGKCGANHYGELLNEDFTEDDFDDSFYAELVSGGTLRTTAHTLQVLPGDDVGCSFEPVKLGTANTRKTCKGLCTSSTNPPPKVLNANSALGL